MLETSLRDKLLNLSEEETLQAMAILESSLVNRLLKHDEYPIYTPLGLEGAAKELQDLLKEHEAE